VTGRQPGSRSPRYVRQTLERAPNRAAEFEDSESDGTGIIEQTASSLQRTRIVNIW